MRKYFITLATFLLHNTPNVGKVSDIVSMTLETTDKSVKEENTNPSDTLEIIKKGDIHSATWYNMHGHKTASGQKFHKDSLTAAYNFSKLGTYLRVTNTKNNLSVIVKVNDRMGIKSRNHIDLSKCAFDSIANPNSGRIKVIVEEIKNH